MPILDLWILCSTCLGFSIGAWSIYWVRTELTITRILWGRRVFVATLVMLGLTGLLAALAHAGGLAPLGLVSGLLVVAMLWEPAAGSA